METKHTKGQWMINKNSLNQQVPYIIHSEYGRIANILNYDSSIEWIAESEANAKLIAAAPELLEALNRAYNDFKNSRWTEETYDLIEIAIKKATE